MHWYLRYGLSFRDVEELLAERDIEVDHVTLCRWVQQFTPLLIEAAQPFQRRMGRHWFVDQAYVRVPGSWRYVYRASDQDGQVIDVFVSKERDLKPATKFLTSVIAAHGRPTEITTDRANPLVRVVSELVPDAVHDTTQYANNRVEAYDGRPKARRRPMRGLKRDWTANVGIRGHAFIQNLGRAHSDLGMDACPGLTLAAALDGLAFVV